MQCCDRSRGATKQGGQIARQWIGELREPDSAYKINALCQGAAIVDRMHANAAIRW
jgi:hypothetical protein